ncbi:IucA/IucC family siderophore biosynthesis protein, partial [Streptomyces sp. PSKA30]|nr:IucA/IucC family siderophore biosynthesis protein [Streptomyces sp. PSKA30]
MNRRERVERVDPILPPAGAAAPAHDDVADRADAYAAAPLLNCLLREVALPLPGRPGVHRLPGVDRLLRVCGGRRPAEPELYTAGRWHRLDHTELVKLVAEELRRHTG